MQVQIKNIRAASILFRLLVVIIFFVFLSACARTVGDFGRASPNVVQNTISPQISKTLEKNHGEVKSSLNFTDEEKEMYNRVWRFLVSSRTKNWFYDIAMEWKKTKLTAPSDNESSYDRYYSYLRSEKYTSSKVRYFKLASDIDDDINTMPDVFNSICKTIEIDRRRAVASTSIRNVSEDEKIDVRARKLENLIYIDWLVRALRYRYQSYSLALEKLLVETPHAGARDVDRRLSEFVIDVERAERKDFCATSLSYSKKANSNTLPSRFGVNIFNSANQSANEIKILK